MTDDRHPNQNSNDPEDMAEEIADAVFEESEEDGLTRKEKEIENIFCC